MYGIKAEIEGRLVGDPEVRTVGGDEVTSFRIAVDARRKQEGEKYAPSIFVKVSAWKEQSLGCALYKKGDKVKVIGNLKTRIYERNGVNEVGLDITAFEIEDVFGDRPQGSRPPTRHEEQEQYRI